MPEPNQKNLASLIISIIILIIVIILIIIVCCGYNNNNNNNNNNQPYVQNPQAAALAAAYMYNKKNNFTNPGPGPYIECGDNHYGTYICCGSTNCNGCTINGKAGVCDAGECNTEKSQISDCNNGYGIHW